LKGKEKESSSDADIEDILDQVVQLFSYISDKDEFEEISRKALCKRLLNTSSKFNENWERSFVAKLKARHGDAFTRRLQGMFNDSQDETIARMRKKFEEWNSGDKVGGIALSLQVLSGCFWPLSPADKIPITALPPELSNCVSRFEEFYKIDTQNRKLRWIYNHGSVNINANYGKGKLLQFVMSPLQACILLLFNTQDTLTFEEIFKYLWPGEKMGSKVNSLVDVKLDDQLRFALGPLISGGKLTIKIFTKTPEDIDSIKPTDKFTISKIGVVKRKRIVFPVGSAVQMASVAATEDQLIIQKQREFEADAAMVRVMKTRNVLKWNDLQIQVLDALKGRFKPEMILLKKRLESLIDRKFLERDPNDRNLIKYIA